MANEFSGDDRRALEKMSQLLKFFRRRDRTARDPKRTASLSTRTQVFDVSQPTLKYLLDQTEIRIEDCLGAERGVSLPNVRMPTAMHRLLMNGFDQEKAYCLGPKKLANTFVSTQDANEAGITFWLDTTDQPWAGFRKQMFYTWDELGADFKFIWQLAARDLTADEYSRYFTP